MPRNMAWNTLAQIWDCCVQPTAIVLFTIKSFQIFYLYSNKYNGSIIEETTFDVFLSFLSMYLSN